MSRYVEVFNFFLNRSKNILSRHNKIQADDNKLRVVLDMDECIVCCEETIGNASFHLKQGLETLTILTDDNNAVPLRVHLRPGLHRFLFEISQFADLYIMTSAKAAYAIPVINMIDPDSKIFKDVFTRDNFDFKKGKDLRVLGDRYNVYRTVLVDNMDANFAFQRANGLLVREFFDDPYDKHLDHVLTVLKALRNVPDVRDILKPLQVLNRYYYRFADEIVDKFKLHDTIVLEEDSSIGRGD